MKREVTFSVVVYDHLSIFSLTVVVYDNVSIFSPSGFSLGGGDAVKFNCFLVLISYDG